MWNPSVCFLSLYYAIVQDLFLKDNQLEAQRFVSGI